MYGTYHGRHTNDECCIENIASHDITNSQIGRTIDGRHEAHKKLGHRRSNGHNGETDDYLGHTHALGQAHGAIGKAVSTPQNDNDARHEQHNLKPQLWCRERKEW